MEGCFRWLRCWRNSGSSSWSKRPSRHPMHLHRHQLELVDFNGKPTSGLIKDTVVVPFYGRAAVEFTANQPGLTLFHCHIQAHMDYGFKALFRYGERSASPALSLSIGCHSRRESAS